MTWMKRQLDNLPSPDTIVHLGAGLCGELDQWLGTGAKRIVLVEANPELLPELRARTKVRDTVEIISAAIAGQSGRGALRLFNFPLLSCVREPTGLYQILPGLRQIDRVMVETITVVQLLEALDLTTEGDHWLVIDTPGEEAAIIEQFQNSDRLHAFSRVFLSAGAEALYQGAETAQELAQRLQAAGYSNVGRPDLNDGDWPRYHLSLDRMALKCREARQQLEQIQAQLQRESERAKALAAERQQLQEQLTRAQAAQNNELKALRAELTEAKEAHQKKAKKAQGLESALTELKTSSEKLGTELRERKKELVAAKEQLAERQIAFRSELQSQQGAFDKQKTEFSKKISELERRVEEKQKAAEKLTEYLEARKKAQAQLEHALAEEREARKFAENQGGDNAEVQRLLDIEMERAEAQIDLIKDILIREKHF